MFLATEPADMRKGFDGLIGLVQAELDEDPFSGALFVFRNRRGNRAKILLWVPSGFWLYCKRLEKGRFRFPEVDGPVVTVDPTDLALLLEGIDLAGARRRSRWEPPGRSRPSWSVSART